MRVLYLHQYFRTPVMTGGTRSYEMARRLVQAGHDVQMVTSDIEPSRRTARDWYRTVEAGINVHWLPVPYHNKMSHRQRLRAFFRFAWSASAKAASLGGDVVFASSTPLTIALPAAYASFRNKIPMVFEVRDLWPEAAIAVGALRNPAAIVAARWLERFAYRHSHHVVALSPRLKAGVIKCGVPREHVSVISNSCDFELFAVPANRASQFRRRFSWLAGRPLVVYTGTIGRVNGLDYLVRVAAAARRTAPELRFLVVGSGRETHQVRRLAAELGILGKTFFFMDSLPKCEMPSVLSAATIATNLCIDVNELHADSANKCFDAMAAGKPIAINFGGSLAKLIRKEQIGLVLDPRDTESAAETLVRAVTDPGWVATAGKNSMRVGRATFDRGKLAAGLEQILLSAARKSPPPRPTERSERTAA